MTGKNKGKKLKLTKALTIIGKPGFDTAAITSDADGYYVILASGSGSKTSSNKPMLNVEKF